MRAIKCVFVLLVVTATASGVRAKLAVKEGERIIVEGRGKGTCFSRHTVSRQRWQ